MARVDRFWNCYALLVSLTVAMERRPFAVHGMDCAGCAHSVQGAFEHVDSVAEADVRLIAAQTLVVQTTTRALGVVESNLVPTAVYNVLALGASVGYQPPVLAAALHSIPSLGILATSSRLLCRCS